MMKLNPAERPDAVQVLQLIRKLVEKQQQVRAAQTPPMFAIPLAVISRANNRLVPLVPRSAEAAWSKPKALPRIHSQSAVKPKPPVPPPARVAPPNRLPNRIVEVVCLDDSENSEDQREEVAQRRVEENSPVVPKPYSDGGANGCGVKMESK